MAADASIYSQIKPATPMEGPLDNYTKVIQLKSLLDQNAMSGLQRQQLQNTVNEDQSFRDIFKNNPGATPETIQQLAYAGGAPNKAMAMQKTFLENKKAQGEISYKDQETQKIRAENTRDATASLTGPQDLPAYIEKLKVIWGPDMVSKMPIVTSPPDFSQPGAFDQWKLGQSMQAKDVIDRLSPKAEKVDTGGAISFVNPYKPDQKVSPDVQKTITPDQVVIDKRQRELNGILESGNASNSVIENNAQMIANGQIPALSGMALNRPLGQRIMARVLELKPEYSAQDYQIGLKSGKDFATGKQGQAVKSFNVAISHLDTLSGLADALNNNDTQLFNKIGNAYAAQTGKSAPTNFNAAKQIVADEIVKAVVGAGGGVADRDKAQAAIDAANSPAQLKDAIATYKELMNGQLNGLRQQYEQSTGKKDFDRFLSDSAKQVNSHNTKPAPSKSVDTLPDPSQNVGKKYKDDQGNLFVSNGKNWVRQ